MTLIGDRELLSVWDAAQEAHPAARPLLLLRAADGVDAPEQLPIATRDRLLLALRERWFGSRYESVVACAACDTSIELTFDGSAIAVPADAGTDRSVCATRYRLPNGEDLLAIASCASEDEARRKLVERCIFDASPSEEAIAAVAKALASEDDLRIAVTCPECGEAWEVAFDPGVYLWHELDAAAIRVLSEVDALASSYGWSEDAILALSPRRRAIYLGMVLR